MNILIYTALFSAAGAVFLFSKGLSFARALPREEFERKLNETKPVFHDINAKIIVPFAVFLHDSFSPKIYKEFEIIISKSRLNVLRMERLLYSWYQLHKRKKGNKNERQQPPLLESSRWFRA